MTLISEIEYHLSRLGSDLYNTAGNAVPAELRGIIAEVRVWKRTLAQHVP